MFSCSYHTTNRIRDSERTGWFASVTSLTLVAYRRARSFCGCVARLSIPPRTKSTGRPSMPSILYPESNQGVVWIRLVWPTTVVENRSAYCVIYTPLASQQSMIITYYIPLQKNGANLGLEPATGTLSSQAGAPGLECRNDSLKLQPHLCNIDLRKACSFHKKNIFAFSGTRNRDHGRSARRLGR